MANSLFKLLNVDKLKISMDKMYSARARGFARGLVKAALVVQRTAQKKTPVDTGLLRKSAKTEKEGSGFNTKSKVSFSTAYAIFVHEDPDAYHEVGEYKFLEKAAKEEKQNVIDIVTRETLRDG